MCPVPDGNSSEERVLRALHRMVASRALAPGQQIRQEELAEAAGVSRLPVRQALTRLSAEGLVRLVPNRGAYLADLSVRELEDLHAVRDLLENEALRQAAARVTDADLNRVEKHLVAMEAAMAEGALDDVSEQNRLFHSTILDLSGNRYLSEMIERCWRTTMPYRIAYLAGRSRWEKVADQHRQIFEALRDRDTNALVASNQVHRAQFVTELIPWLQVDRAHGQESAGRRPLSW